MILFFDDEALFVESYVEALVMSGFEVSLKTDVTSAYEALQKLGGQVKLAIIDVMAPIMGPVPAMFDTSRTAGGLRTGVELLRLMESSGIGREVPKIVLTNVPLANLGKTLNQVTKLVGRYEKRDLLPYQLVGIVRELLSQDAP